MRMLLKFELGLSATNEAMRSGTMTAINEQLMASTKPEAALASYDAAKDYPQQSASREIRITALVDRETNTVGRRLRLNVDTFG